MWRACGFSQFGPMCLGHGMSGSSLVLIALLPCHKFIVDMLKKISHMSEGGRKTYLELKRGSSGF